MAMAKRKMGNKKQKIYRNSERSVIITRNPSIRVHNNKHALHYIHRVPLPPPPSSCHMLNSNEKIPEVRITKNFQNLFSFSPQRIHL